MNEKEINEQIKKLKHSLMYNMSLGSKELFHSNVWAWLLEEDHAFIKAFVPSFNENEYMVNGISREFKNRDLIIWVREKGKDKNDKSGWYYYVIENKLKSIPEDEQLIRYTENLGNDKMLGGILTGTSPTLFNDSCIYDDTNAFNPKWTFIDYITLSSRIRNIIIDSKIENKKDIESYCNMIESICEILNFSLKKNGDKLIYDFDNLKEIRLDDIAKKRKANEFINYLNNKDLYTLSDLNYMIEINQSYSNSNAIIDIRVYRYDEYNYVMYGIQIQGSQYRKVVERNGKNNTEKLYNEVKYNWFDDEFNPNEKNKTIFSGKNTSMKPKNNKKYDSYQPKNSEYTFIYQYYDLNKDNTDYDKLFESIFKDMKVAIELIDKYKFN